MDFDHVHLIYNNVQGQKVKGEGYSVTWRITSKNRYISRTDRSAEFKLCENYTTA